MSSRPLGVFTPRGLRQCTVARAPRPDFRDASPRGRPRTVCQAEPEQPTEVKYNKEFGYSRKDVILIGGGVLGLGIGLYYGMQFAGIDAMMAGNFTQLIIFMGLTFGWVGSYVFRVANKKMTYVTQLEEYEEAVMKKRFEEMTEEEVSRLVAEAETEKERRGPPPTR